MDISGRYQATNRSLRRVFLTAFSAHLALALAVIILFGYLLHQLDRERIAAQESARVELASQISKTTFTGINSDLYALFSSSALSAYLNAPSTRSEQELAPIFIAFLQHTERYDQIRLLDINGQEKIRVNYNHGNPTLTDKRDLQNKSGRYYFKEAMSTPYGGTYISPIDPNMEYGKIEKPIKPVMRFARPLHSASGDLIGVLILSYLANDMLQFLGNIYTGKNANLVLESGSGCWTKMSKDTNWQFHPGNGQAACMENDTELHTNHSGEHSPAITQGLTTSSGYTSISTIDKASTSSAPIWRLSSVIPAVELRYSPAEALRNNPDASLLGIMITIFLAGATARLRTKALVQQRRAIASEIRFQELFERAPEGILISDAAGHFTHINHTAAQLLGRSREALVGKTNIDISPAEEHARLSDLFEMESGSSRQAEWDFLSPSGEPIPVEAISSKLPDGSHQTFFRDITHRRHSEQQMRLAHTVFDGTSEPIIICDLNLEIVASNPAFHRRFTTDNDFMYLAGQNSTPRVKLDPIRFRKHVQDKLAGGLHWEGEMSFTQADGSAVYMWAVISTVDNERGEISNYVVILADISPLKKTEFQLRQLAHLDPLTGLANRAAFELIARQSLDKSRITGESGALMMLDLDKFKQVNDSLGHAAGDKLLITIANRLTKAVRNIDTVVRLGGDEFCIVLPGIKDQRTAATIACKITEAIREPIALKHAKVNTSTSIGIAMYPADSDELEHLMEAADQAMYKAKSAGRNDFFFYSEVGRSQPS